MDAPKIIQLHLLRPTQITVGMLQVKHKRKWIRRLAKRPAELVNFILEHPVRVVLGPAEEAYVIDHHHLALALIKEKFETAPMQVENDFSRSTIMGFWKKMQAAGYLHSYNAQGKKKPLASIPKRLEKLKDDPYRSLAGFVRVNGGFSKVRTPFAEFQWADYYRIRIERAEIDKHFGKALKRALILAHHADARDLPGFIPATPAPKQI